MIKNVELLRSQNLGFLKKLYAKICLYLRIPAAEQLIIGISEVEVIMRTVNTIDLSMRFGSSLFAI